MTTRSRPRRSTARERAEAGRQAAERRRRAERRHHLLFATAVVAAAVAVVVAVVAAVLVARRDSPTSVAAAHAPASVPAAALAGLQQTAPPWQPEYAHLADRLAVLGLPAPGDESYHIHAHLTVYVDGQQVPVPTQVGIDEATGTVSSLHTHEPDGVIHVEATHASDAFTLGAFFDVWGVALSAQRLGDHVAHGAQAVRLYVDGAPVADPMHHVLHAHDQLVLVFGTDGSAPHRVPFTFPDGE